MELQQSIDLIKSIFPGSEVVGREAAEPLPNVLVRYINNLHSKTVQDFEQFLGIYQGDEIGEDFRGMVNRVSGLKLRFERAGEAQDVIVKSRWNAEYQYQKAIYRKLKKEVKGLKASTMLTLTFWPEYVKKVIPDWWAESPEVFLIRYGNKFLSDFLKRLRSHRERKGLRWNYIGYTVEFHQSGYIHYHILFYGKWIAEIDDIVSMWGFCKRQGVNVRNFNSYPAIAYMTSYVKKEIDKIRSAGFSQLSKWIWYFRMRLFNIRHFMKHKKEEIQEAVENEKDKWRCVGFSINGKTVPFKRFTDRECRDFYT